MWKTTVAMLIAGTLLVAACGAPAPTPMPPSPQPSPSPSTAVSTATPQPTPTPVPTPAPTLAIRDINVFVGGAEDWEMAATSTNANGIAEIAVLRAITDTVEIYAECIGDGRLAVSVNAAPPLESPPPVPPSPYTMSSFEMDCPDTQGVSFGGAAPAGLFVSVDGAPSDPSVRYQILVATAKS